MTATLATTAVQADKVAEYSAAFDDAWQALSDALVKLSLVNDLLYDGDVLVQRVPAADASLIRDVARTLKLELQCFDGAREASKTAPILPGEVRYGM